MDLTPLKRYPRGTAIITLERNLTITVKVAEAEDSETWSTFKNSKAAAAFVIAEGLKIIGISDRRPELTRSRFNGDNHLFDLMNYSK
jgi:hypothetical protein